MSTPDPHHGALPRRRRADLGITIWASRQTQGATDYYAGGRSFCGFQNGLAIGGDYMSAASFLGIAGTIALNGYDGFLYSIGFLVAWLVALLLVAELLRNSGRYTMADQLAYRMRQRPVRTAAATSTVVVSIFYLLAQMVGAGALVTLLLGVTSETAKDLDDRRRRPADDLLRDGRRHEGHHLGADRQGRPADGRHACSSRCWCWRSSTSTSPTCSAPRRRTPARARRSSARAEVRRPRPTSKIDFISLGLALVLGTAGLPHILIRFYTVPTARAARKSVLWAIGLIGALLPDDPGARLRRGGAARHPSADSEVAASGGNMASPLLAEAVGGGDGIHRWRGPARADRGGRVRDDPRGGRRADADERVERGPRPLRERLQARHGHASAKRCGSRKIAAFVIGGIAIALAIPAQKLNIAFLVALAFAVAASANLPSIIYNLFWRRFNTRGATWSIYGGLLSSVILVFFSPVVSGKVDPATGANLSLFPLGTDFHWFPLENPGIVSIPLGLLLRLARHRHVEGAGVDRPVRRARGPVPDRRRLREGGAPLNHRTSYRSAAPAAGRHDVPRTSLLTKQLAQHSRSIDERREGRRDDADRAGEPHARGAPVRAAGRAGRRTPTSPRRRTTRRPPTGWRSGRSRPSRLDWAEPFDEVLDWSNPPFAKWFVGGRLNAAYNCVDRHVEAGNGDRVALHWVGEPADDTRSITYAELQDEVCKAANALTELGVADRRPGRDLHADDPGDRRRDAGLRPARRAAHRGLRRVLGRRPRQRGSSTAARR